MINRYDEKITRKLFFSMVPVQILLVMCGGVNIIIDGWFASNMIGPDAIAVTGLYGPLAKVLDTINALLFGGAQILCGKYLGENTVKRTRGIFTLDIVAVLIVGVIFTVIFAFFPSVGAGMCTDPGNPLYGDLIRYLNGISSGVIPFLLGTQLTSFLQLEKKEKFGYFGIGGMFLANTVCDYIFIKVLDLGIFGLGLATAVSNWVPVLICASYFFSRKSVFFLDFSELHIKELPDIARNGFPMAGTQFMLAFKAILINLVVSKYAGSDGLAAFAAVNSFGYVYWAVPAGMSSALVSLASIYSGEKDKSAIELLMRIYLKKAIPVVAGVGVMLALLAYPLTNLFFHEFDGPVYFMTLVGFAVFPFYTPFSTFIVGMRDLWRCMGHKIAVNIIVVCDGILIVTAMSYILPVFWGMNGIWIAQAGGCVLLALIVYIMAWIMNGRLPSTIADLCCYPDDFGVDESNRLNLSIHNMEEAINISEKVIEFCEAHNIDDITSNRAGLCIEELAGNIVIHGFPENKKGVIDISITKCDEELIIKLKDNCRLFNPKEIGDLFTPEDPAKNIGIRLVRKTCKEMEYHPLLGLNVLSITM